MRFVVVYQREPHAGQMAFAEVEQPRTRDERAELARRTLAELRLDVEVWIDDLGDQSRAMFGDLPNPVIVIDPEGTLRLKLSWCEPPVLALTLPEIARTVPKDLPAPVDTGFLAAITQKTADDPAARHHRRSMLAHLAVTEPDHPDRERWLRELAADGPPEQRAWATRQLDRRDPSQPGAGAAPPKAVPPAVEETKGG